MQNIIKRLNSVDILPVVVSSYEAFCQPDVTTGTRGQAQGKCLGASFVRELVPDVDLSSWYNERGRRKKEGFFRLTY